MINLTKRDLSAVKESIRQEIERLAAEDTSVHVGSLAIHEYEAIVEQAMSHALFRTLGECLSEVPRFCRVDLVGYAAMLAYDRYIDETEGGGE